MSSNSPNPGTSLNNLPRMSGEGEGSSSASDGLRRLRMGKRGRPPLDPTQNGLVERRRNQVRQAQRAYRSRKEEEAASRMHHAQILENRIAHMRTSFLELVSLVTRAEITQRQPDLTRELQRITHNFLSASQTIEPLNELHCNDSHAYLNHSSGDASLLRPDVFSGIYTSCTTESPVPASEPLETPMSIPAPPLGLPGSEVPLPRNFAQRLYFTCIKRAHGLLTNPSADGSEVARVFQYTFQCSDANTMISTLDTLLRTNSDYQTAYVYRLGGAGTHYKGRQTDPGIDQNVWLGPEMPSMNSDETWFDPRDIEGWLEEHGLLVGGAQSFMYLSEFRGSEPCRSMAQCPEAEPSLFSQRDIRQSAKIFNVDQFLGELLSRGVCLGCAPGFRRLDVEAAFSLAITDDTTFIL